MTDQVGVLAALATAVAWAASALLFEAAGRRMGSLPLNLLRLAVALVFFALLGIIVRGHPLPSGASAHTLTWLSLSGLVGFTLGDLCLFRALVLLGARRAMLVMALAPLLVAGLGVVVLGEHLRWLQLVAMVVTIAGVAWVVAEPRGDEDAHATRERLAGFALALGGAGGQAGGLVLAKHGMGDYDPFAATQIRVLAGLAGFVVVVTLLGAWPRVLAGVADRRAMLLATAGAFVGPFLGVGLALLALQHALAGVAATLMSLTPVLLVPLSRLVAGERVTWRAACGTVVAFLGVALLVG